MYYLINLRQIKIKNEYSWQIMVPVTEKPFNGMGNGQSEVISERAIISLKNMKNIYIEE